MESIKELKNSQVHYNLKGDLVKHLKAMKGLNLCASALEFVRL
jgi:hypothetical protein